MDEKYHAKQQHHPGLERVGLLVFRVLKLFHNLRADR